VRVSTVKQGEHGVSLQEQRVAIERYAAANSLEITRWFEEQETGAKRGRPIFSQMLRLLKQGCADGVIIHKIDRSARNLKDWADLGELIDFDCESPYPEIEDALEDQKPCCKVKGLGGSNPSRVFAISRSSNVPQHQLPPQPSLIAIPFLKSSSIAAGDLRRSVQPIPSSTALCLVNWIFAYSTI
jgi:hypothetical protein